MPQVSMPPHEARARRHGSRWRAGPSSCWRCWRPLAVADDAATIRLQQDPREILESVARQMNVTLRADEPLPKIHLESATPLEQFQDAVEQQWNFRPPRFANVYAVASNEIYLTDDPGYYRRVRRTLDESLAHEFAHYLQVRYFAANLIRRDLRDRGGGGADGVPASSGGTRAGRSRVTLARSTQ